MPSLILALRFLTILPVPGREAAGVHALGRAAWWFPVVGLALGLVLAAADQLLALLVPPLVAAVLVLCLWKVTTGGIHLDGLADSLDGFGRGSPAGRLASMRAGPIGAFGTVGLILVFLVAIGTLAELPAPLRWRVLLLAPVVGRLAPLVAGPCFRAATPEEGIGGLFLRSLSAWSGPLHLAWALPLAVLLLGPWGWLALAAALGGAFLWSLVLSRRLGGLTGDALGAGVELAELGVLLAVVSLAHLEVL